MDNLQEELLASAIRLPLAALLGTVLALRPRRRGTPARQPPVEGRTTPCRTQLRAVRELTEPN